MTFSLPLSAAQRGFVCAILIFTLLGGRVQAQSVLITVEPSTSSPPVIDDRPSLTDWVANVQGASLIEGRLEFSIFANAQFQGSVLTDELVLTGVDQRLRILLPAFNWSIGVDEVVVQITLHTKEGVIRLPEQRLRASLPMVRKFPLLLGETKQRPRSTAGRDKLADRLRFESLLPVEMKDQAITVMSQIVAEDFPQEPLTYCHYETVVLADDVFAALRTSQLDALRKWIEAGGSLYLEPAGILEPGQWNFLNQLARHDARRLVFTLDDQGRLAAGTFAGGDGFLHLSPGLGRVVLGLPEDDAQVPAVVWRNVAASLWKIRDDIRSRVVDQKLPPELMLQSLQHRNAALISLAGPPLADITRQMVDWLRPQGVRMVPLWVIAMLLTGLVVLIGPVDFLVLGWLKRRKWTWITFPICVLVITGLTVGITNAYLSSAEARRSLVLHDVADDGTIVRSNRFELVFTSSTRRLITEVQAVLFSPLLTGGQADPRNYQRGVNQQVVYVTGPNGALISTLQNVMGGDITYSDPVSVQGRIPTRYQVYQDVRQWTPQLNRHFSIGQPADALAVDWSGLSIPNVAQESSLSGANWQMLLFQIRSQLGPQANLAVCTTTSQIMNTDPAHNARPGSMAVDAYQRQFQGLGYLQNPGVTSPYDSSSPLMNALLRLTSSPSQGLASLTSQTSPHGGRSLDDLPLSIAGTTDRWWLLVIVPQGDNIVVIRKSFRYAENSLQPMLAPAQLSPGS